MHGRLKVKTTAEQAEAKAKEQAKKLKIFQGAWQKLVDKRSKQEYDREMLDYSGEILSKIPDFYTLWNIRKETLSYIQKTSTAEKYIDKCREELSFTEHCLQVNPKSYGCWEHRCWLMTNMPDANWKRELTLCNRYLDMDERNFHCWDYRRFLVNKSSVSAEDEFKYTTEKISTNFSNFSSWHYRSTLLPVLHGDPENATGIEQSVLRGELGMVQSAFFTDPNDQSAWFYHRWLLGRRENVNTLEMIVYHLRQKKIFFKFTKPVNENEVFDLIPEKEWFNKRLTNFKCVSIDSKYSTSWISDFANETDIESVREKLAEISKKHSRFEDCEYWTFCETDAIRYDFSAATKDLLVNELDMLQQLHELEPDNKWAMLTIISIMRSLDKKMADVDGFLLKLTQVDPSRVNYYNDMRSKYTLENYLRQCEGKPETETESCVRSVNLSSLNLTALYYADQFLLITTLNLTNNNLVSLKGVHLMLCLKNLQAGKNRIKNLDALGVLPELTALDLRDNRIDDINCVEVLKKQPKLTLIDLSGNPVMEPKTMNELTELLSTLRPPAAEDS